MKRQKPVIKDMGRLPVALPTSPLPKPALLWPSISVKNVASGEFCEYNSESAPEYDLIKRRRDFLNSCKDDRQGLGCAAFRDAIYQSSQILIMDNHLDKRGVEYLFGKCFDSVLKGDRTMIQELRLITAEKETISFFKDIKNYLRKKRDHSEMNIGVAWTDRHSSFIHDRFAVTDCELWHFGGTVGGEKNLTAVSRGWNAETHKFISFFNEVWQNLDKQGRVQ